MTRAVLDREVPGIAEAIRAYGVAQRASRPRRCRAGLRAGRSDPDRQPPGVDRAGSRTGWPCSTPILAHALDQVARRRPRRVDRTADRRCDLTRGWPVRLSSGRVGLRPITMRDAGAGRSCGATNLDWLGPWESTRPPESAGAVDAATGR